MPRSCTGVRRWAGAVDLDAMSTTRSAAPVAGGAPEADHGITGSRARFRVHRWVHGLAGHRYDGTGWAPRFSPVSATVDTSHVAIVGRDDVAGLELESRVELDPSRCPPRPSHGHQRRQFAVHARTPSTHGSPARPRRGHRHVPRAVEPRTASGPPDAPRSGAVAVENRTGERRTSIRRSSYRRAPASANRTARCGASTWRGAATPHPRRTAARRPALGHRRRTARTPARSCSRRARRTDAADGRRPRANGLTRREPGVPPLARGLPRHPTRPRPVLVNTWEACTSTTIPTGCARSPTRRRGRRRTVRARRRLVRLRRDDTPALGDWWCRPTSHPAGSAR